MSGFDPEDRVPMGMAVSVILVGNAISFALGMTLYVTILIVPVAVAAFGATRYVLYGRATPDGLSTD